MAMRRRRFKRGVRKTNPYEVQRFHMCRTVFQIGGAECDQAFTDSKFLIVPGVEAAAASGSFPIGPLVDGVSKGVVLGGMRFWLNWGLNSGDIPAAYADVMTLASVMFWIAKVPIDPETLAPAWIPDPMLPSHQGDRAQRENLLWTRLDHIPVGWNNTTTGNYVISSTGAGGYQFGGADVWGLYGPSQHRVAPYRVKTKRFLSEFDVIMFGVTSVTGVTGGSAALVPIAVDLYGQAAIKRSNRHSGL